MLLCLKMCLSPTAAATVLASQCLVLPLLPLCAVILSSQLCLGDDMQYAHNDFSVRNKKTVLLVLFLAYSVMKRVRNWWNWGGIAFTYRDMGAHVSQMDFPDFP